MSDEPSITCPRCGRTSYNPTDIEERYCGACDLYHDQMTTHRRDESCVKWGCTDLGNGRSVSRAAT